MIKVLIVDLRRILKPGINVLPSFPKIDESIFDSKSLMRLFFILTIRRVKLYFIWFPLCTVDPEDFMNFWIENRYPGNLIGMAEDLDNIYSESDEGRYGPLLQESDDVYVIESLSLPEPISDEDVELALYHLDEG